MHIIGILYYSKFTSAAFFRYSKSNWIFVDRPINPFDRVQTGWRFDDDDDDDDSST